MILSNIFSKNNKPQETIDNQLSVQIENQEQKTETSLDDISEEEVIEKLERKMERQLKDILEKSEFLSEVEVMINLDSTNINIYEKNLTMGKQITDETDQSGGKRKVEDDTEESQIVLIRTGDQERPLLIQTQKPDVRGVLVVAKGLEQVSTQKMVMDAVSKVLDVPNHRISVMNKQ